MFDAVSGSILSAGGSPSYQDSNATPNAHLIKLGNVGSAATVTKLPNMAYARAFANGVVLPDGTVLIVGGQSYAVPFTDTNSAFPAELFDPKTNTWRSQSSWSLLNLPFGMSESDELSSSCSCKHPNPLSDFYHKWTLSNLSIKTAMASIAVPRNYHSIALLLPDATVVAGGGGLCGTGCAQNHFDLQVFTPPYLFNANGTRAARPAIRSVSATQVRPGAQLTITTAQSVASFSLVRYGSATHTVNTDQRRVPLSPLSILGFAHVVMLPSDPGVLVPGYWMLFAISSAGVPSVATTIKVLAS